MAEEKNVVVVGVDGSVEGAEALRWAVDYADRVDADLLLATVWQRPVSFGSPVFWPELEQGRAAR